MSDVESSRASENGAPPWTGAAWTAWMRSAVPETRWCQQNQIQLWQRVASRFTGSFRVQSDTRPSAMWFYGVSSLPLALPQVTIELTCNALLRQAIGKRVPAPIPIATGLCGGGRKRDGDVGASSQGCF